MEGTGCIVFDSRLAMFRTISTHSSQHALIRNVFQLPRYLDYNLHEFFLVVGGCGRWCTKKIFRKGRGERHRKVVGFSQWNKTNTDIVCQDINFLTIIPWFLDPIEISFTVARSNIPSSSVWKIPSISFILYTGFVTVRGTTFSSGLVVTLNSIWDFIRRHAGRCHETIEQHLSSRKKTYDEPVWVSGSHKTAVVPWCNIYI